MPKEIFKSTKHWPYFANYISTLNGLYIFTYIPTDKQILYWNQYGNITQNILVVVDFKISFTYILLRWEGFVYNSKVFKDTISKGFNAPLG
jgi:hypothetical protein